MPQTVPGAIGQFTVYPQRGLDPLTFAVDGDSFVAQIPTFITQTNSAATVTYNNAVDAYNNAVAAAASATAAANSSNAALNATNTQATSTNSIVMGTGSKSLTLAQTGKAFAVNQFVTLVNDSTHWMVGIVTAFNSGTGAMTVNVLSLQGTGTLASWSVFPAGFYQLPTPASADITGEGSELSTDGNGYIWYHKPALDKLFSINTSGVVLPDLTTVCFGGKNAVAVVPSNVTAPTTFATSDGWTVTPGGAGTYGTTYAGTAHGVWGSLTVEPNHQATSATYASTVSGLRGVCQLTSTLYVALWCISGSGYYAQAVDTAGGTMGAPVQVSTGTGNIAGVALYAISTTNYVAVVDVPTAPPQARAGSVSGTTITQGTGVNLGATNSVSVQEVIQLSATQYVLKGSDGKFVAFSIAGTVVSAGSAVAAGSVADSTMSNVRMIKVSATSFLVGFLAAGGGTSTTRAFQAKVGSIAANVITLNAAVGSGSNTSNDITGILLAVALGSNYVFAIANGVTNTSTDFRNVTVSGTVPTIGAATNRTDAGLFDTSANETFNYLHWYNPPTHRVFVNGTTGLYSGAASSGNFAYFTSNGTTVTVATVATSSIGSLSGFLQTIDGVGMFAVSATGFARLSFSGGVPSVAETVLTSVQVKVAPTTTVNDAAVKYGSTWYTLKINGTNATFWAGGMMTTSQGLGGGSGISTSYLYSNFT